MKLSLLNQIEKLGFVYKQIKVVDFLNKRFKVVKGTLRTIPDKDDAWLFELARHHKVIFDVGSNIGQAAMLMLYHDNVDKIILIDPNPKALSYAAENLIMNNLSHKAHFFPAFISDRTGDKIELYTVGAGAAGSKFKGFARTASKMDSHFSVNTVTLDSLRNTLVLKPDLVKIDVEGAEYEVLKGASHLAAEGHTTFFVEMHSGPELSITNNTERILDWCGQVGYRAWYLKNKELLSVELIKNRGRYHALLLPGDHEFPECLKNIDEGSELTLS